MGHPKPGFNEWSPVFLEALRESANVSASCQKAGICRDTAYKHREKNDKFAHDWEQALEEAVDTLETVAWRRARDYSDTLLIFLLKAHRPLRYRESASGLTPDELAAVDKWLQAMGASKK